MFTLQRDSVLSTDNATYQIVGPLGEGGRGQTYLATVATVKPDARDNIPKPGTPVVIKIAKIDEDRGMEDIRYFIGLVDKKLMEEATVLTQLKDLPCVAHYIDTGTLTVKLSTGEYVYPRFLAQEFIAGKIMTDHFANKSGGAFHGLSTAAEWFKLSTAIVEAMLAVHQCGVIHNDLWPKNIMLKDDETPIIIDFGEAVIRKARKLAYLDQPEREDAWIAPEWEDTRLRPSRRADIFSLGGILYWMACGLEPPSPAADREETKTTIEALLKEHNAPLLAENAGIADIVARCRRQERSLRTGDAEKLRHEILAFSREPPPDKPVDTAERVLEQARCLVRDGSVFIGRMADMFLRDAERKLEDMKNGIIEISGKHEDLVSGCVDALATLKQGDEYLAVSTLRFWKPENIGTRGRFHSMTRLCAQRRVKIRRIFLLTEDDFRDKEFRPIIEAQIELGDAQAARYLMLSRKEFEKRIQRGDHCGFWMSGDQVVEIVPYYDTSNWLRSIRLLRKDVKPAIVRARFEKDFERARPLEDALMDDPQPAGV